MPRAGIVVKTSSVLLIVLILALGRIRDTEFHEIHEISRATNFALADPRPTSDDWPWWRGPTRQNLATVASDPTAWPESFIEGWAIALPGFGNSSPIVAGSRIYVTSRQPETGFITLSSIEKSCGKAVWRIPLERIVETKQQPFQVEPTPAFDGENLFVTTRNKQSLTINAINSQGRIQWRRDVGPSESLEHAPVSPIIFGSMVIALGDDGTRNYIVAVHRQTGEIIWRLRCQGGKSFGTPTIAEVAGKTQLLLSGNGFVESFDPVRGVRNWSCRLPFDRNSNSVTCDNQRIFVTGTAPRPEVVCIDAAGSGDVTETHIKWRVAQTGSERISPACDGGFTYVLAETGRLTCISIEAGKVEWIKQLQGTFAASPVIAGDYIVCLNQTGVGFCVPTANPNLPLHSFSILKDVTNSPAIVRDSIVISSNQEIQRIDLPTSEEIVERPQPNKKRL